MDRKQYVKIYTDQPEDYRWGLLDDTARAVWVEVLCWSKREGTKGALPDTRSLAHRIRRTFDSAEAGLLSLSRSEVGWIERTSTGWQVCGWDTWQRDPLTPAQRVKAHREQSKQRDVTDCNETSLHGVTDPPNVTDVTLLETRDRRQETNLREREEHHDTSPPAGGDRVDDVVKVVITDYADASVPVLAIVDAYHAACCPPMPKVAKLTDRRRALIRARWHEDPERQTLDWWQGYFRHCAESRFLRGEAEGRGDGPPFMADLEWLTRPSSMVKVLEGKYHREGGPTSRFARTALHNAELAAKLREEGYE